MNTPKYTGQCNCGRVKYKVPYAPQEIANCHCTICQSLHNKPFVSFAKYNINDVIFIGRENLIMIPSSERASRGYCRICNTLLFMLYKNSQSVWIHTGTFNFNVDTIKHYNIYTDTAVVKF